MKYTYVTVATQHGLVHSLVWLALFPGHSHLFDRLQCANTAHDPANTGGGNGLGMRLDLVSPVDH